jgi:hypothetical protein
MGDSCTLAHTALESLRNVKDNPTILRYLTPTEKEHLDRLYDEFVDFCDIICDRE